MAVSEDSWIMGGDLNTKANSPVRSERALRLIKEAIGALQLDLSGQVVLTEVGSNNYLYAPIIPALAGAKKVFAWTRDTQYGKGDDIRDDCLRLAGQFRVKDDTIEIVVNKKEVGQIKAANIVTNSGFLRPIDAEMLKYVDAKRCVIPLMYEAWEYREQDLDIHECHKRGIKVAGTWENHPDIRVFDAVGPLALKLALEAGYEIHQNTVVVWGEDEFCKMAGSSFKQIGVSDVIMTTDPNHLYRVLPDVDFVFFSDYKEQRVLLGEDGILNADKIKELNPSVGFVHLYGALDYAFAAKHSLNVYPKKNGASSVMTESLAYLGERPVIYLQAAGFKVAQCLLQGVEHSLVQPM